MTNRITDESNQLVLPVPEGAKAGEPVKVGGLIGVLLTNRARTDVAMVGPDGLLNPQYDAGGGSPHGCASVATQGTFSLPVPEAVTDVGSPVFFNTTTRALTTTAGSNTLFGHALSTKKADAGGVEGRVNVKLLRV